VLVDVAEWVGLGTGVAVSVGAGEGVRVGAGAGEGVHVGVGIGEGVAAGTGDGEGGVVAIGSGVRAGVATGAGEGGSRTVGVNVGVATAGCAAAGEGTGIVGARVGDSAGMDRVGLLLPPVRISHAAAVMTAATTTKSADISRNATNGLHPRSAVTLPGKPIPSFEQSRCANPLRQLYRPRFLGHRRDGIQAATSGRDPRL
jgi:hypothetical protein